MSKAELARVEKALAWAQKRLGTAFHFTLVAELIPELGEDYILAVSRTSRGAEDPDHYKLYVNSKNTGEQTAKQLRSSALHEVLHCVAWPMYELIPARKAEQGRLAFEALVYRLERAFGADK